MSTTAKNVLFLGLSLASLGVSMNVPTKTIDLSNDGADCDLSTEQYMQIEGLDMHDHPKFTLRWRQLTGACGVPVDESELVSWEVFYDGSTDDAPDEPSSSGSNGRSQLNLFVCCPFGHYELEMDIESFSDEGTSRQARTSWEIENGPKEFHIWDTFNNEHGLAENEDYAPKTPGVYTWPLEGETGYYKTIYAGPLPPLACASSLPSGTELIGCFEDSNSNRLLDADSMVRTELGQDGMSPQVCSDFCSDYDFFGLESGNECFCGTADEFESAVESRGCGTTYPALCNGDSTSACGGFGAISVYERTGVVAPPPPPTPTPPAPADTPAPESVPDATPSPVSVPAPIPPAPVGTPSPVSDPAPTPTGTPETTYSLMGCFADSMTNRIMKDMMVEDVMSAEICVELCNDGYHTHFGTQFAEECWCAVDPMLTKNGEMLALDECDMECEGTTSDEFCGGTNKITAYRIDGVVSPFMGCYADDRDARALNMEGKYVSEDMTNKVCISFCAENGHAYAGTQFYEECWCGGDSFDMHGEISEDMCSFPCAGDADQTCGGFDALSVYSTA